MTNLLGNKNQNVIQNGTVNAMVGSLESFKGNVVGKWKVSVQRDSKLQLCFSTSFPKVFLQNSVACLISLVPMQ
jgi:hypothetical protein